LQFFILGAVQLVKCINILEALSITPFALDKIVEEVNPKAWCHGLLDAVHRVIKFFQDIAATSIEGTLCPIVLSLLTLADLSLGASLMGGIMPQRDLKFFTLNSQVVVPNSSFI
jgi:hypothetical protein